MRVLLILLLSVVACFGQAFSFRDIPYLAQAGGTDWARRVVANGGAQPSANSDTAMEKFRTGLIAAGLTNKIKSLAVLVEDSVIATATPLIVHAGYPMWTNNFVQGDLTIHGIQGDGTSKFMQTGVMISDMTTNVSYSVIVTERPAGNGVAGAAVTPFFIQNLPGNNTVALIIGGTQNQYYRGDAGSAVNFVTTNEFERIGFVSANSIHEAGLAIYVASPVETFGTLATNASLPVSGFVFTTNTFNLFASKVNGTNQGFSAGRISLACLHAGFTRTEASNFWVLAQACRASLGGGTGNPVHNWANKVTVNGGAAVSTTTSNALTTFLGGMFSQSLYYKCPVVNCLVPDNLTAARLPLIYQNGLEIWANNNYGASNLTVNGLIGDGATKWLNTSISPAAMVTAVTRGFANTSAGSSFLISEINSTTNTHIFGGGGTAANSFFGASPYDSSTNYYFFGWKFINSGTDFVAARGPVTNFTTFASGNRTAANAIALYWVTNGVHTLAVNGTGNQTGSSSTITNMVLGGAWAPATGAGSFSPYRISFAAVHAGLSQTESSNLWVLANAMRTSLGGGNL